MSASFSDKKNEKKKEKFADTSKKTFFCSYKNIKNDKMSKKESISPVTQAVKRKVDEIVGPIFEKENINSGTFKYRPEDYKKLNLGVSSRTLQKMRSSTFTGQEAGRASYALFFALKGIVLVKNSKGQLSINGEVDPTK